MNRPPKAGVMQTKWELAGQALQKITTDYNGKLDLGLRLRSRPRDRGDSRVAVPVVLPRACHPPVYRWGVKSQLSPETSLI
jgi:hypothetical protein